MCNPRRLVVNLTHEIDEEWRATAEETATARVDVRERLERVIPLGARLGPSSRLALSAALAEGFHGWRRVEGEAGRFTHEIGPLQLSLDTGTAELSVAVERQSSVSGTARAAVDYSVPIHETIAVEESGISYDDGYRGLTQEAVQQRLDEQAQARVASEVRRVIDERSRPEREAAERQATAEAQQRAAQEAATLGEEERGLLLRELEGLFLQSRSLLHDEVAALIGETLRRSVLHLVLVNGGELRRCEETDDAIVIEAVL